MFLQRSYLFLSTKPWCKPCFGDDKFKDSDNKFKTGMFQLSTGNFLNLIFKLCSCLFWHKSCLLLFCRNPPNTSEQAILKNLRFRMLRSFSVDAECSSNNFFKWNWCFLRWECNAFFSTSNLSSSKTILWYHIYDLMIKFIFQNLISIQVI